MNGKEILKFITKSKMPDKKNVRDMCLNQSISVKKTNFCPIILKKRMAVVLSATFIMVITFLVLLGDSDKNFENNSSNTIVSDTSTINNCYPIPDWSDLEVQRKFQIITYNNTEYSTTNINVLELIDGDSCVGNYLCATTSTGYSIYENGKEYTINCEIYALNNISTECAVAVKFEGYEGFYSYKNQMYYPETLGNLINDLNLRENLEMNHIYYNGNYYTLPDMSVVWELLLSDTWVKNSGEANYGIEQIGLSVNVKVLGHMNISLSINEEGYLITNILDTGKSFYIGKDKVNEFIKYVQENGMIIKENEADTSTSLTKKQGDGSFAWFFRLFVWFYRHYVDI